MKVLLLLISMWMSTFATQNTPLNKKYSSSKKCVACHQQIVDDWKDSWHAKSHFKNDEYYSKTLKYLSRKMRSKNLESLKVECATCHNPRISITSTTINDEIALVMGLNSRISDAVNSSDLEEGINCIVCHNINDVHEKERKSVRGAKRIEWMQAGVMGGPYKDAQSPYHKTDQRDFMDKDPNKLCFACHANKQTTHSVIFSNMEDEYKKVKGAKLCVDCHMGEKEMGIVSTLSTQEKAKQRLVRSHSFEGAHSARMIKDALKLSITREKELLQITLKNPNPHNIPSGYGGRELVIDVDYFGVKKYSRQTLSLTAHYRDKRGKPSVPYFSVESTRDMSVPAMGSKKFLLDIPQGASAVSVSVWYKLVNDRLLKLLDLKEKRWSKKNLVVKEELSLD